MARKRPGPEQPLLELGEKPDDELTTSELARLIRRLRGEIAPLQARLRRVARLHSSKVAADRSRASRAQSTDHRSAQILAQVERLQEEGHAAVTEKVAAKFGVSRRTVQRALCRARDAT